MRVAIAGAGIAGSFLAHLLMEKGIAPDVYDPMDHSTRCGYRSCGWGAPAGIAPYLAMAGLDLSEYLLEPMPSMCFDGLTATTPLCTIDKPRLLKDLTADIPVIRQRLGPEETDGYDVLVDATGIARALLPPCRSDLTLPTVQHRVAVELRAGGLPAAGVYGNQVPGLGYLWVFPVGGNEYHIGVGGIGFDRHERLLERYYRDNAGTFACTRLCSCRGVVRVSSPFYAAPLYSQTMQKTGRPGMIVGVGESIGTVAPFTGEGIVFSLESSKMLAEAWPDYASYARAVLARFAWMKKERETLDYLLSTGRKKGPRFRDRWRFFRSARRSGIGLPLIEAFRQIGTLSRWIDDPES